MNRPLQGRHKIAAEKHHRRSDVKANWIHRVQHGIRSGLTPEQERSEIHGFLDNGWLATGMDPDQYFGLAICSYRRLRELNDLIADKHSIQTYSEKDNQNYGSDEEEKREELCFEQERSEIHEFHNNNNNCSNYNNNRCLATTMDTKAVFGKAIPACQRLIELDEGIADKHSIQTYSGKTDQNFGSDQRIRPRPIQKGEKATQSNGQSHKDLFIKQKRNETIGPLNKAIMAMANPECEMMGPGYFAKILLELEEGKEQKRNETMGPLNKAIMAMANPECEMTGPGHFAKKLLELEEGKEQRCKVDGKRSPEFIRSKEQNLELECLVNGFKKCFETDLDLEHHLMCKKGKGHKETYSKLAKKMCGSECFGKKLPEVEVPRKQNHEGGYKRLPESKQFEEQKLELECPVHGCKKRFETYLDLEHHLLHTVSKPHEKAYVKFVKKICHPECSGKKLPKPEKHEERDSKPEFRRLTREHKLECPVHGCKRRFESELVLEHHLLHTKGKAHEKAFAKFIRNICQGVSKEPD